MAGVGCLEADCLGLWGQRPETAEYLNFNSAVQYPAFEAVLSHGVPETNICHSNTVVTANLNSLLLLLSFGVARISRNPSKWLCLEIEFVPSAPRRLLDSYEQRNNYQKYHQVRSRLRYLDLYARRSP
jgi:hypothetical protein